MKGENEMKQVVVLFGKPGAGKGTRLSEFLEGREEQFEVLSVGNLLRKARKEQTELGKKAAQYMDAGVLVPDDLINALVIDAIKNSSITVITDGYPRTIAQAETMLNSGIYPDIVVDFFVDDETVLQRARDRIVCEGCGEPYTTNAFKPPKVVGVCDKCNGKLSKRKDDSEDVVKQRLKVYANETYPVLDVFQKANVKVVSIDNNSNNAAQKFQELLLSK